MKKRSYRNVVAAVYNTSWAILPEKLQQITELLAIRSSGTKLTKGEIQARIGPRKTPIGPSQASGPSKVALLDVFGTISQRMSTMNDISGGTSAEAIGAAFDQAIADDTVSAVVMNFDTPGGSVNGMSELSKKIFDARGKKPVIAFVNPSMASAGYWFGSAADQIIAAPSATEIGSIGVLRIHADDSKADEEAGIVRTVISSTEFKGEGFQPLSESAKTFMQEKVMGIYDMFVSDVARNRGITKAAVIANYGKGRSLLAKDALAAGMVDRIATLDQVLSELGVSGGSAGQLAAVEHPSISAKEVPPMDAKLKTKLIRIGACDSDTPDDQAMARLAGWMAAKGLPTLAADATTEVILKALEAKIDQPAVQAAPQSNPAPQQAAVPAQQPVAGSIPGVAARGSDGLPIEDMISTIQLAGGLTAEARNELIADLTPKCGSLTLKAVNAAISEKQKANGAKQPTGVTHIGGGGGGGEIQAGNSERDKFHASARDAILLRAWGQQLPAQIFSVSQQDLVDWKPNRRMSNGLATLPRLAESCLLACGLPYHEMASLAPSSIARLVMGATPMSVGLRADAGDGLYNVSGMFSNLLIDAAHVLLRRSYSETNTTFQIWAKQGPSAVDFKNQNRVIVGELSDPKAIPEDGEFEESTLTDSKEAYKLTVWGEIFSLGWQAIVNDQFGAFAEVPTKQGRAMRRKQNKIVYGVLNDNANLADGGALFNSTALTSSGGHNNLAGSSAVVSVTSLNLANARMAKMTGLNVAANTVLNIEPKFILYPPDIDGTVKQVLNSTSDPQAGGTNAGNANSTNVWRNRLIPVSDAQLSAVAGGSDTAWYLAADPMDVDTVEYAFLQGLETPVLEQSMSFERLGMKFRIYHAFAAKALDFRGLQKNAGA